MATPIGELGLDTEGFEAALNESIQHLRQFDSAVKATDAQIKLLEKDIRDTGATAAKQKELKALQKELQFYQRELRTAQGEVKAFEAGLKDSGESAKKASLGFDILNTAKTKLIAALSITAITQFGRSLLDFGKNVSDTAKVTGTLPSQLLKIQTAFANKLSAEDTASALHAVNIAMQEAKSQSVEAQDKFANLGVSMDDIKKMSPDQVLIKMADYVSTATDKTEALRRVIELVGADMAAKLIPKLMEGSKALQDQATAAQTATDSMVEMAERGARGFDTMILKAKQLALALFDVGAGSREMRLAQDRAQSQAGTESYSRESLVGRNNELRKQIQSFPSFPTSKQEEQKSALQAELNSNLVKLMALNQSGMESKIAVTSVATGTSTQTPTEVKDARSAELDLLKEQSDIHASIDSDMNKQVRLAEASAKFANQEYELKKGQGEKIAAELEMRKSIADEQLRSAKLARDLSEGQAELNNIQSTQGRGYEEERRVNLAEVENIEDRISKIRAARGANDPEIASLGKQRRDLLLNMQIKKEAHDDALTNLRLQTKEMEAQKQGLLGLVPFYQNEARYNQQILQALRERNTEAANLLQKQKEIAATEAKAAAHDVTTKDRREAKKETRQNEAKAKQLDAQDAEQLRRYETRKGTFGRDKNGNEMIPPRMAEALARKAAADQSKAAKQKATSAGDPVGTIIDLVKRIALNTDDLGANKS